MTHLSLDRRDTNSSEGPVVFVVEGSQDEDLVSAPHRHARGQLFISMQGLLSVGVEDGVWIVPAIHAVWLPPHHLHSGRSYGPFHGWNAYVAEEACRDLPSRPCTIRTSGLLREAVLRASTWPPGEWSEQKRRVVDVILDEIRTLPIEPFGLPLPTDARLQKIAQAIIKDPADDRALERWADWAAIGSRTLSRRFVAETGFNFTAWRQRARLMRSLEMLAEDMPVQAVAFDLGYSSASAFISLFKRTFGATPAAYRRG